MSAVSSVAGNRWLAWLRAEWLLVLFAMLALVLALFDPQPMTNYQRWLQWPTLAGLCGLLIAIQGILDSGLLQHAAGAMVARMHSLRSLGLLLVGASALLSMLLTNDVSLFLLVPLTVAISRMTNLPVVRMVVLQALAVNAGSALSPIGNPQNLLLWQHGHLPLLHFVLAMLPAVAVMLVLLTALTALWLPGTRVALAAEQVDGHAVTPPLAILSTSALATMVLLMEHGHAMTGAVLLLAAFGVLARRTLTRVDWWLLATFAAIFLGLGHFAALPAVGHALDRLDFSQPWLLYLAGIVASQLISNVPATVLLLERTPDTMALALAVNVGGFGLAIGSLANLIALRLARQPCGLRRLHMVSIPFLLVCAPLAYLAWRWLG